MSRSSASQPSTQSHKRAPVDSVLDSSDLLVPGSSLGVERSKLWRMASELSLNCAQFSVNSLNAVLRYFLVRSRCLEPNLNSLDLRVQIAHLQRLAGLACNRSQLLKAKCMSIASKIHSRQTIM